VWTLIVLLCHTVSPAAISALFPGVIFIPSMEFSMRAEVFEHFNS
jgi:hypothetical protein